MSQRIPELYIHDSQRHGKGVFCGVFIPSGSLIEVCPIILIPEKDMPSIKSTILYDYYFEWEDDGKSGAIALGFGSIYNHDYQPNARYFVDFDNQQIEIHAVRDISPGEEICVSYNGNPEDQSKVWFEKK